MTSRLEPPTAAEKAAAADLFVEAEGRGHAALGEMRRLVCDGRPTDSHRRAGDLFPVCGDAVLKLLDQAQQALWEAHELVAVQGYDAHQQAARDVAAAGVDGG